MASAAGLEVIAFVSQNEFHEWLDKNHADSNGIWMRIYKKGSDEPTVTYAEALDEALCYGWIDGQKKSYDDASWIQKFTPRRPRSQWSKINTGHVERLTKEGRMKPAGIDQVKLAKKDGRWDKAYSSQRDMPVPDDFLAELDKNDKAKAFFESLNKANRYAIAYRLHDAKRPETRARRMTQFLDMMAKGEKLYP
jgi:uncharacterized protein YdeI (YjbR/CyaY-like superfamily)